MPTVPSHWLQGLRFLAAVVFLPIAATVGCAGTSTMLSGKSDQPSFFTLRVAFNDSTAGRERVQYGATTYFLAPEVLLSDDDVLSASSVMRPDAGLLLNVRFRPESGQRLSTATTGHIGEQIAVLLDSRVWNVARIAGPVGGVGSMIIATGATGRDAERIARQVRSRWP